jgi:osmoprotectant transport system permease protein
VLVGVACGLAIAIGIPLGVIITRKVSLRRPVLGFVNTMQTIPSLALFGFLLPIPLIGGIGARTAIVTLFLYALLPIVRNTYVGITNVDPAIREAGRAMGMSDWQLITWVELPLALGVIVAGVRVAVVICVGTAAIAAAIGAGGLGEFIFRGLSTVNNLQILLGAVPAALMALSLDFGLGWLQSRLDRG